MTTIRVTGLAELRQGLEQARKALPKELAKAHKQIGKIVADEAIRDAPKGPHQGGGRVKPLASTIKPVASSRSVIIKAGGPNAPHAPVLEFGGLIPRRGFSGLSRRGKRIISTGSHVGRLTHVKAQPYLLPAAKAKEGEVVAAWKKALVNVLDKVRNS